MQGPHPGGGAGAAPGPAFRGRGTSLAPLPPSLELSGASLLGLTSSLCSLPQAETPLITTCRQNAPPAAGYHCPPRRSARAAVRLHDRQCECPAGWLVGQGLRASSPHPKLGPPEARISPVLPHPHPPSSGLLDYLQGEVPEVP